MMGQWFTVRQPCGCNYDELRVVRKDGKVTKQAVQRIYRKGCATHPLNKRHKPETGVL